MKTKYVAMACVTVGCAVLVGGGWKADDPLTRKDLIELEKQLSKEIGDRDAVLIGTITAFAGEKPPKGWLLCDGSPVDAATYPQLASLLGTRFGETTGKVVLPDLRGRFPVGAGSAKGRMAKISGEVGGSPVQTLSLSQMPPHTHEVSDPGHAHGVNDPGHKHRLPTGNGDGGTRDYAADGDDPRGAYTDKMNPATTGISVQGAKTGISIQSAGSGEAFSIMPPYQAVNYIIKAQ